VVAGPHGAGFANIVFCQPNTTVVEFGFHRPLAIVPPKKRRFDNMYFKVAQGLSLDYWLLMANGTYQVNEHFLSQRSIRCLLLMLTSSNEHSTNNNNTTNNEQQGPMDVPVDDLRTLLTVGGSRFSRGGGGGEGDKVVYGTQATTYDNNDNDNGGGGGGGGAGGGVKRTGGEYGGGYAHEWINTNAKQLADDRAYAQTLREAAEKATSLGVGNADDSGNDGGDGGGETENEEDE
jgi:hypothetical protein